MSQKPPRQSEGGCAEISLWTAGELSGADGCTASCAVSCLDSLQPARTIAAANTPPKSAYFGPSCFTLLSLPSDFVTWKRVFVSLCAIDRCAEPCRWSNATLETCTLHSNSASRQVPSM